MIIFSRSVWQAHIVTTFCIFVLNKYCYKIYHVFELIVSFVYLESFVTNFDA